MITLTSKVNTITEQYLERFGKARVAVYHLVISQQEPFSSFLNALMIKRLGALLYLVLYHGSQYQIFVPLVQRLLQKRSFRHYTCCRELGNASPLQELLRI